MGNTLYIVLISLVPSDHERSRDERWKATGRLGDTDVTATYSSMAYFKMADHYNMYAFLYPGQSSSMKHRH